MVNKMSNRDVQILIDNLNDPHISNDFNISYNYILNFVLDLSNFIIEGEDTSFIEKDLETIKSKIKKNQLILLAANLSRLKNCCIDFNPPTWVKDMPKLKGPICLNIDSTAPNNVLSKYNIYIPEYQIEEKFGAKSNKIKF